MILPLFTPALNLAPNTTVFTDEVVADLQLEGRVLAVASPGFLYVNGQKVTGPHTISGGDVLKIQTTSDLSSRCVFVSYTLDDEESFAAFVTEDAVTPTLLPGIELPLWAVKTLSGDLLRPQEHYMSVYGSTAQQLMPVDGTSLPSKDLHTIADPTTKRVYFLDETGVIATWKFADAPWAVTGVSLGAGTAYAVSFTEANRVDIYDSSFTLIETHAIAMPTKVLSFQQKLHIVSYDTAITNVTDSIVTAGKVRDAFVLQNKLYVLTDTSLIADTVSSVPKAFSAASGNLCAVFTLPYDKRVVVFDGTNFVYTAFDEVPSYVTASREGFVVSFFGSKKVALLDTNGLLQSQVEFDRQVVASARVGARLVASHYDETAAPYTFIYDPTPEPFSLGVYENLQLNMQIVTPPFVVSGINAPVVPTYPAHLDLEFVVDGAVVTQFSDGDEVQIRFRSPGAMDAKIALPIAIGNAVAYLTVSTFSQDVYPTPFDLAHAYGNAGDLRSTNEVTIAGLDDGVAVTLNVSGGTVFVNGMLTPTPVNVVNGDKLRFEDVVGSVLHTNTIYLGQYTTWWSLSPAIQQDIFGPAVTDLPLDSVARTGQVSVPSGVYSLGDARNVYFVRNGVVQEPREVTFNGGDMMALQFMTPQESLTEMFFTVSSLTHRVHFSATNTIDLMPDYVYLGKFVDCLPRQTLAADFVVSGLYETATATFTADFGLSLSVDGLVFADQVSAQNGTHVYVKYVPFFGGLTKLVPRLYTTLASGQKRVFAHADVYSRIMEGTRRLLIHPEFSQFAGVDRAIAKYSVEPLPSVRFFSPSVLQAEAVSPVAAVSSSIVQDNTSTPLTQHSPTAEASGYESMWRQLSMLEADRFMPAQLTRSQSAFSLGEYTFESVGGIYLCDALVELAVPTHPYSSFKVLRPQVVRATLAPSECDRPEAIVQKTSISRFAFTGMELWTSANNVKILGLPDTHRRVVNVVTAEHIGAVKVEPQTVDVASAYAARHRPFVRLGQMPVGRISRQTVALADLPQSGRSGVRRLRIERPTATRQFVSSLAVSGGVAARRRPATVLGDQYGVTRLYPTLVEVSGMSAYRPQRYVFDNEPAADFGGLYDAQTFKDFPVGLGYLAYNVYPLQQGGATRWNVAMQDYRDCQILDGVHVLYGLVGGG